MLVPTLAQVNVDGFTVTVAILQLSVEPLFICEAIILAVPAEFKATEMFCVNTVGKIVSVTVTTAVPVFTLPFTSVTVNVTVLVPTLAQVNVDGFTVTVAILQLSVEPLFICEAVILAVPDAFKATEMFCVNTVGRTVSANVTVNELVAVVLYESVTVTVIVAVPVWLAAGVTTTDLVPFVPENTILALGTKVVFDDVAVNTKLFKGVFSSLIVKLILFVGVFGQTTAWFAIAVIVGGILTITNTVFDAVNTTHGSFAIPPNSTTYPWIPLNAKG